MSEQNVSERMQALLAYANYAKVGSALGVSRASVSDWAAGKGVTPYRLMQVEQLLGPGPSERPAWVDAAIADMLRELDARMVSDAWVAAVAEKIEARLAPSPRRSGGGPGAGPSSSSGGDAPGDR